MFDEFTNEMALGAILNAIMPRHGGREKRHFLPTTVVKYI